MDEIVQRPTVLIGNSVGSLACVIAAAGVLCVFYVLLGPICYTVKTKYNILHCVWTGLMSDAFIREKK